MKTVDQILNLNFDEQYGLNQGLPSEEIGFSERGFKELPVKIKLAEKRSDQEDSDVDEKKVSDATKSYRALVGDTTIGDVKPVNFESKKLSSIDGMPKTASLTSGGLDTYTASDAVIPKNESPSFMEANDLQFEPMQDPSTQSSAAIKAAEFISSDSGSAAISKGMDVLGISNDPITKIGDYNLPGYPGLNLAMGSGSTGYANLSTAQKQANLLKASQPSTGATTFTGQAAGVGAAILGGYSAFEAAKGGIDSPQEGLQFATGTLGALAGLQTAGLLGGSQFIGLMGGPVGWALMGATFLASSGILGGGGKNKPPMGGVEINLIDESGKLTNTYEEGKNLKIAAGAASSYNGFNSQAMKSQTQKNIDYMYAFADEFGLKVNEKAWAEASFGPNKYMPRGREKPYRSALEKIDSMGDGSSSPTEWLRHAMEYKGENGQRIVEGDVYKGTKIGPDGMPTKVGYKSQEAFQQAVAKFNKKFYG